MSTQERTLLPRRQFVKTSTASLIGASLVPRVLAAQNQAASIQELELWQPVSGNQFTFPSPRYPKNIPHITTVEQLLPVARQLASIPPRLDRSIPFSFGIHPGQKALMIVPSNFDPLVVEATTTALREKGILVDQIILDISLANESRLPQRDGEARGAELEAQGTLNSLMNPRPRTPSSRWFIDIAKKLNHSLVIEGTGGPLVNTTDRVTEFVHQHIPWPTRENFFLRLGTPHELRGVIDRVTMRPLLEGGEVRITDPEGTDLTYTIFPEQWSMVEERERRPRLTVGHLWGVPQMVVLSKSNAQGVIAGTANSSGMYPRIKLYLENQKVVKIEGGGRYGDAWREIEERSKEIQWPEYPRPGFSWFIEAGIGTEPGCVPGWCWNNGETRTSGTIHFGIGVGSQTERFQRFIQETGLPGGHLHVHARFATYDIKNSRGRVVRVIEKGRLTAFDDPEVREVAAKYGDPDLLLRELWVPAIPGVNYPGDYERDYAEDPMAWLKRWRSILEQEVDRVLLYGDRIPKEPIRQT